MRHLRFYQLPHRDHLSRAINVDATHFTQRISQTELKACALEKWSLAKHGPITAYERPSDLAFVKWTGKDGTKHATFLIMKKWDRVLRDRQIPIPPPSWSRASTQEENIDGDKKRPEEGDDRKPGDGNRDDDMAKYCQRLSLSFLGATFRHQLVVGKGLRL